MYSFRETRQQLAIALGENIVNDEEFLLLWDANKSKNPDFPVTIYPKFNLKEKDVAEVKAEFRFEKNDLPSLHEVLRIPDVFRCQQGSVCDGMTGLCIVLKRLTYPCRYSDMISTFGISVPELCMVYNTVIDYIFNEHGHLISQWNHTLLSPQNLQRYADSIAARGAALQNCFGFVDGTVRPICRPKQHQKEVFNGHKRVHSLKFQSVVVPNGMIANLYGPVEGKRHDSRMLVESNLLQDLENLAFSPTNEPLCLYGDPAYPLRLQLQAPFREVQLTPEMVAYNESMSKVRVSVEWLFGDIINYFKFMDFKKNLKIGLSQVGKMYIVAALLRNALTCLYTNETSQFFDLNPPSLQEYFS
ncbi:uncharacterized protein LOC114519770 [Dendronephthya gigantea]|uniref:uncharacterized protein LOC114519770 n=1 Tax=Dendronephthya gigantea TaxID=151771 RepID=UPI00106BA522|nr:uncharacterized protein LOC114519770 [Dendronephthya gigantea]